MGVLKCLHEKGHLITVKRVAGTSAGALTASFLAVGFSVDKLEKLLMETNIMTFLDHPFKALDDKNKAMNTLREILRTCSNFFKNPLGFMINQLKKLYHCTGLCEGELFRKWFDEHIEAATGKKFLTFGELAQLVKQDPKYKHLHVYGIKIGKDPEIVNFNSQDPNCKDMIISDAARISMSIPGIFKPHIIHILKIDGNKRERIPYPNGGSFLDGGMIYNFPVETFDQKQYLTQEDLGPEGKCPKYNKETIGFSLFSSLSPPPVQGTPNNIKDLITGIAQVYLGAEAAIRAINPYNQSRVIEIDAKDVGTLSFNLSDQKKRELIDSGFQAVRAFIDKKEIGYQSAHAIFDKQKQIIYDEGKKVVQSFLPTRLAPKKKKTFQNHMFPSAQKSTPVMHDITPRKSMLMEKRTQNHDLYPPYFHDLLEKGYIHLFDHLIAMTELPTRIDREKKAETLTFSEISHIILETKRSVVEHVTSKIPSGSLDILFLLGQTGSGKSTTFCFLRGDKMQPAEDGNYSSKTDQILIGHGEKSCTFLPTVGIVNNMVFVDFPGFSDTNGPLVALGLECALKSLINLYHPTFLVIESITNTESRYAAAAQLGTLLNRLLGNLDSCILGITKYSKNVNFMNIQKIEAEQQRLLSQPSQDRISLEASIKTLTDLNIQSAEITNLIKQKQKELDNLKIKEEKQRLNGLPETDEKKVERQNLEKKEQDLKKQIGIKTHFSFFDLESDQKRKQCFNFLKEKQKTYITNMLLGNTHKKKIQILDEKHEQLLKKRFEEDLKPAIEQIEFNITFDYKFEKNVLDTSLINVLLSSSHPEIGEFLHLPEIDPKLASDFSKNIVQGTIQQLMDKVIKTINVTLIKKLLEKFGDQASYHNKERLQTLQKQVQRYIFGLKGKKIEEQTDKEWEKNA